MISKLKQSTAISNSSHYNSRYRPRICHGYGNGYGYGKSLLKRPVTRDKIISPRSQWEECICPVCDELMNDPVLTSCGHQMCYECFNKSRWDICRRWCLVRDNDGQKNLMSKFDWSRDRIAEWKINRLLLKCTNCKVECTVKRYRKFDCSTGHDAGVNSILISPRSQWGEYICPDCDELMDDPVLTSCGHRMCYKCFDKRRRSVCNPWCPVRDDHGQVHGISQWNWSRDRTAELKINGLPVECEKCKVECTVKEYRKIHCTPPTILHHKITQEKFHELSHFLVNNDTKNPPHWKQVLVKDKVITSSDLLVSNSEFWMTKLTAMGCKQKFRILKLLEECTCHSCRHLSDIIANMMSDSWFTVKADTYTKMASLKTFRELEKFPPDQQQQLIAQVLKEALPAAKDDLFIDDIRPQLYQNGVITSEEATELLGIFTGEEKVTRLYTKMLPNKGAEGLKKFMELLYDTGWDTPSHMEHHGVLSITLSEKLSQIKSAESLLSRYDSKEAAKEAIVPMVYSESLPDAVFNLNKSINKLLIPMLKKHIVSTGEYCWLRGVYYPGKKLNYLYKEVLPQKGAKGLKAFLEVLQDVGRKVPKYQNHQDQLKSSLQAHLSKF